MQSSHGTKLFTLIFIKTFTNIRNILEPIMVVHALSSTLKKVRQDDCELRAACATW